MKNKNNDKTHLKPKFVEAYKKGGADIDSACESVGISRSCYKNWRRIDPDFAQALDDIDESAIDFVESKLMQLINANDPSSIHFFLKTRGMKRGYNEKYNLEKIRRMTARQFDGGEGSSVPSQELVKSVQKKVESKKKYYISVLDKAGKYKPEKASTVGLYARVMLKIEQLSDESLLPSSEIPIGERNERERQLLRYIERAEFMWRKLMEDEEPILKGDLDGEPDGDGEE